MIPALHLLDVEPHLHVASISELLLPLSAHPPFPPGNLLTCGFDGHSGLILSNSDNSIDHATILPVRSSFYSTFRMG